MINLLITSGMHGNEFEVIDVVQKYLEENKNNLPEFCYIPQLSPTAVATKTRKNGQGNDLNRSFIDNPTDSEAVKIINDLKDQKFDLILDFHEDPVFSDFYMYDSGKINDHDLESFRNLLRANGIGLLTGIDDEDDPYLGFKFEEGYASFQGKSLLDVPNSLGDYTLKHGITKRFITLEIPGIVPITEKAKTVKIIFENFLPKLYNTAS